MARTKTRNDNPYPLSPSHPPTHNLWLKYEAGHERMQIHCWCTDWATYRCLEIALNGREYHLVDEVMGWYETDDGELRFRIIEPEDGDLLRRKPTNKGWTPGQPTLSQLKLAAGIISETDTPHEPANETREKNRRKTRAKSSPAVTRNGLVSISDICAEIGMNPRDARKILRNKVEKPDAGWAWPESEVANIKKLLK